MITPGVIEVGVRIAAPPGHVFGFFTDPARYTEWMGSAARHVRDGQAPADGSALQLGSSRVEVLLAADGDAGTRLTLRHHDLATAELREAHREAWTAYLARLVIRAAGGDPGPDPHA